MSKLHILYNVIALYLLKCDTKAKKLPKRYKIVHISVCDKHKIDFTKKPKAFSFFNIFKIGEEFPQDLICFRPLK